MNLRGFCTEQTVKPLLDAGLHPLSNRFLRARAEEEAMFPLTVGQCQKSGIICLTTPIPPKELVPRFDWVTYNEPEPHLDHAVELLWDLCNISENSVVGGITFKDDTTLARFAKRGCKTWRLDIHDDLDIVKKGAGAESIQMALRTGKTAGIVKKYGRAHILIVRHFLEHVYDLAEFTAALKEMTVDHGYIVFEIPDSTRSLEKFDYTMLWEEHLYYFTPATFKVALGVCDFLLVHFESYPYPLENSLVAVVRPSNHPQSEVSMEVVRQELARGERFAEQFDEHCRLLQSFFVDYRRNHGKIAFLGAGHLASTFIGLFQLQDFIEFVVDDNPHKQGLFMPGSRLPIVFSKALVENDISLCLLSTNPLNEEKVIANNKAFVAKGGQFLSIFPASKHSLHRSGLL